LDDISNYQITRKKVGEDHLNEAVFVGVIDRHLSKNEVVPMEDYLKWMNFSLNHLDTEENLVLQLEEKMGDSVESRRTAAFKKFIVPSFVEDKAELLWFVGWVTDLVSNYGCEDSQPVDCVAFLALSLQNVTTPEQFDSVKVFMKAQCAGNVWDIASKVYNVEQHGLQSAPSKAPVGEDPRYEKFFKMMKYGIPLEAVAHKMVLERAAGMTDEAVSILELNPEDPIPQDMEPYLSLQQVGSGGGGGGRPGAMEV
jgi:hypothetical protein